MDRDKLINRIRVLKAMTTGAGCTEAEAMVAAEKAAALMAEYSLSEEQLEVRNQADNVKSTFKAARSEIWVHIAYATNCAMLHQTHGRSYRIVFVGVEPGPEIACYLLDVCDRAIDRAIADFKQGAVYKSRRATSTRRKAVEDFTVGMVGLLGHRLAELFSASKSAEKRALARDVRDEMFPNAQTVKTKDVKPRFWQAVEHGRQAGDRVNLAHGIKDESSPAALLGASRKLAGAS